MGSKNYSHPTILCRVLGLLREKKSFIITNFSLVRLASTTYRMSYEKSAKSLILVKNL